MKCLALRPFATLTFIFILSVCFGPSITLAATSESGDAHALDPSLLLGIATIWVVAKVCGEIFERLGQPAVLGELLSGIILGNLVLFGIPTFEPLKTSPVLAALAEIGVIILLFEVGLESSIGEMLEVGWSSLFVALLGVIFPFFLGWGVSTVFTPDETTLAHIFIGATLCATSVGITARVLKDIKKISTPEARIILGAAVIDDVLGLLILAVVTGIISAATTGATLSATALAWIVAKAIVFLIGAIIAGRAVVPIFKGAGLLESRGVLLTLSLAFCFAMAWAAAKARLAPIVGAFAAGLMLDDVHFQSFAKRGERDLRELIEPVGQVLVPIFFVLMGFKVDLREMARPELLGFAAALTVAAVLGKQICSLGVTDRKLNRLAVGIGMVPRGEVGLIFAGIGASLMLPNAEGVSVPVVGSSTFGALVIMVIVTTLITPPLLKWSMNR
jgi:Kef-type K+ transport system membrane component KefB